MTVRVSGIPDAADPPAKVNDVRMSDNGVVECFDGVAWMPYRELPDPEPIIPLVFRGSNNGEDPR